MLVYIIDDHEIFLLGLKAVVQNFDRNIDVKTFTSSEKLYESLEIDKPELLIADQVLTNTTGLEVIMRVRSIYKSIKAILISSLKESELKNVCIEYGIQAYIYKSEFEKDIHAAIQSVMNGKTYFSDSFYETPVKSLMLDKINPFSKLTHREIEVVRHLALGLELSEIAEKMDISLNTVKNHRANITEKLGKMSLTHLILKASAWGIIKGDNLYTNLDIQNRFTSLQNNEFE